MRRALSLLAEDERPLTQCIDASQLDAIVCRHPSRLTDEFVAGNAAMGNRLVEITPDGEHDGYVIAVYDASASMMSVMNGVRRISAADHDEVLAVQYAAHNHCACGQDDCDQLAFGYPWCRTCQDHHRMPECEVNEAGEPLAPCGCTWTFLDSIANTTQRCPHRQE